MKRLHTLSAAALIAGALTMQSFIVGDDTMIKEDGMFVINTTTLGKDVEGYAGPTPVKVYIKNNKVEKIEFLKTQETPKYYLKLPVAQIDIISSVRYNNPPLS